MKKADGPLAIQNFQNNEIAEGMQTFISPQNI